MNARPLLAVTLLVALLVSACAPAAAPTYTPPNTNPPPSGGPNAPAPTASAYYPPPAGGQTVVVTASPYLSDSSSAKESQSANPACCPPPTPPYPYATPWPETPHGDTGVNQLPVQGVENRRGLLTIPPGYADEEFRLCQTDDAGFRHFHGRCDRPGDCALGAEGRGDGFLVAHAVLQAENGRHRQSRLLRGIPQFRQRVCAIVTFDSENGRVEGPPALRRLPVGCFQGGDRVDAVNALGHAVADQAQAAGCHRVHKALPPGQCHRHAGLGQFAAD